MDNTQILGTNIIGEEVKPNKWGWKTNYVLLDLRFYFPGEGRGGKGHLELQMQLDPKILNIYN
jgi:hypothetical protein